MSFKEKGYEIKRIVNNNVIVSCDKSGEEIVLMGSGIAFKRKAGMMIPAKEVEKMFVLKGNDKTRYFDIVQEIPVHFFDISKAILRKAQQTIDIKVNSIGYIMLADHIFSSVERMKDGVSIKNDMQEEIKCFHPKEFAVGLESLKIIKEMTDIQLPEDEAGFIAYHILNLSSNKLEHRSKERIELINKIIEIIENYYNLSFDKKTAYYERFLTHLDFFSKRYLSEDGQSRMSEKDDFLYRMLKVQYPETTKCVNVVKEILDFNYGRKITDEEMGYLIVHITNLISKTR